MGCQKLLRRCGGSLATTALIGVLLMLVQDGVVEGRRVGDTCDGNRAVGDKWFDGCQWCVCTLRGVHCSRSDCSGLEKKVPACHTVGERWEDGCYRCRCKRHGITCRLDSTCLLLRHHPVPCLADNRCVCGPDGVPSCTAEVIDRHAFSARRVDLGFPTYLAPDGRHEYPAFQQDAKDLAGKMLETEGKPDAEESSQELLIMSDNLCRFGPRWYGGSLRCFCDIDGSITCGNPIFVTAFIDNFSVRREECEEGHVWEEGCSVCSCRVNGVTFCRRSRDCRHEMFDETDDDSDSEETSSEFDHYLPLDWDTPAVPPEPTEPAARHAESTSRGHMTRVSSTRRPSLDCVPGTRWQEGCARCHCSRLGRVLCSRRQCHDKTEDVKQETHRDTSPVVTDKNRNHAKHPQVTMWPSFPRGPRGPMMVPPRPASIYRPPAYMAAPKNKPKGCGNFRVGSKYWKDCNLCLCTRRGPKCQAKLCR